MGTWDRPVMLPYRPSFLEQFGPAILSALSQVGLQKLGQDFTASQKKIETEQQANLMRIKGLAEGIFRQPVAKPGTPQATGQLPGQGLSNAAMNIPFTPGATAGPVVELGGKQVEITPPFKPKTVPVEGLKGQLLQTGRGQFQYIKPEELKAPTTRKVMRGGKIITEEWNRETKSWSPVGTAPRETEKPKARLLSFWDSKGVKRSKIVKESEFDAQVEKILASGGTLEAERGLEERLSKRQELISIRQDKGALKREIGKLRALPDLGIYRSEKDRLPMLEDELNDLIQRENELLGKKGLGKPLQAGFQTAEEVRAAYQAGKISESEATGILQNQFGME